jgi:hypothetical protein
MGFSPHYGLKDSEGNEFHIEARSSTVVIWSGDETREILRMSYEEARKLADDLNLVCSMNEGDD